MDPLSITISVLTLVTKGISFIQVCQEYATKYQLADLSITALRTECASIRVALLQIQAVTSCQDGRYRDFGYVVEEYKAVLSACSVTFSLLNEKLGSLGIDGTNKKHERDVVSKLKFIWQESTMELIRQNIRGQAIAITLLLTAIQAYV